MMPNWMWKLLWIWIGVVLLCYLSYRVGYSTGYNTGANHVLERLDVRLKTMREQK